MRAIFKYPLEITDVQTINLPYGFVPLTVQMQGKQLTLWAEVDSDARQVPITIEGIRHWAPNGEQTPTLSRHCPSQPGFGLARISATDEGIMTRGDNTNWEQRY